MARGSYISFEALEGTVREKIDGDAQRDGVQKRVSIHSALFRVRDFRFNLIFFTWPKFFVAATACQWVISSLLL
jgi:hypothetical protein